MLKRTGALHGRSRGEGGSLHIWRTCWICKSNPTFCWHLLSSFLKYKFLPVSRDFQNLVRQLHATRTTWQFLWRSKHFHFLTPAIYTYAILRAGKPDLHGPKLIFTVTLGVFLLYMYIYLLVYKFRHSGMTYMIPNLWDHLGSLYSLTSILASVLHGCGLEGRNSTVCS